MLGYSGEGSVIPPPPHTHTPVRKANSQPAQLFDNHVPTGSAELVKMVAVWLGEFPCTAPQKLASK